jgi:hypothetical protein
VFCKANDGEKSSLIYFCRNVLHGLKNQGKKNKIGRGIALLQVPSLEN